MYCFSFTYIVIQNEKYLKAKYMNKYLKYFSMYSYLNTFIFKKYL